MSLPTPSATETGPGTAFVEAIVVGDPDRARPLFADPVDFRAVTPSRAWEAWTPDEVVAIVLGPWFGPDRGRRALAALEEDRVGDRHRVTYRLGVHGPDGEQVVEQTAYFSVDGGLISWMRVACSGFRPLG
jgi:hypothetical protein